jgi:4-carboxymuconolactone decarboxylase
VIVEQRRYTLTPGGAVAYLRAWHASGRTPQVRHLGEPLGVYTVEVGALNTLVYLWSYADSHDRERRRAALATDEEFATFRRSVRDLVTAQHTEILNVQPTPTDPTGDPMDAPATQSAAQVYLDDMVSRRGYVLDYHKAMAANDFPVLQAADQLVSAAYLSQRTLSRATKELLFVLSLTVLRADPAQIASHIRVALAEGASAQEILEALEIALPEAGVVAFQHGFDVWRQVVGAQVLEPSRADD